MMKIGDKEQHTLLMPEGKSLFERASLRKPQSKPHQSPHKERNSQKADQRGSQGSGEKMRVDLEKEGSDRPATLPFGQDLGGSRIQGDDEWLEA
jgi:hypothetical protein